MKDGSNVSEILWATLRALDASPDPHKDIEPVLELERQILRTIILLGSKASERNYIEQIARFELIFPMRDSNDPEDAA